MKKIIILFTLIALLLTACGNTQVGPAQTSDNLPAVTQLALGTLKLKGTDQVVTNDQAQELLPLWQIYQELSNSDNAAQTEFEAVTEQIQETMTTEQMQAITDMKLTQQDVSEVVQAQKITSSSNDSNNADSARLRMAAEVGWLARAALDPVPAQVKTRRRERAQAWGVPRASQLF
jgi:hypothetical protein